MKTLITIIALLFTTVITNAQTTYQQTGNELTEVKVPKTEQQLIANATKTVLTFKATDNKTYPVYQSVNNKLFIVRTSKTNTVYKQYITKAN